MCHLQLEERTPVLGPVPKPEGAENTKLTAELPYAPMRSLAAAF